MRLNASILMNHTSRIEIVQANSSKYPDSTIEINYINDIIKFLSKDPTEKQQLFLHELITKPHIYEFSDSSLYWGEQSNGLPNGFGIKYKKGKKITIGQFKNGKVNDIGFTYFYDGKIYCGNYTDGYRNGAGTLYNILDTLNFEKNINKILSGNCTELIANEKLYNKYVGIFSNMNSKGNEVFNGKYVKYLSNQHKENTNIGSNIIFYGKQQDGKIEGKNWINLTFYNNEDNVEQNWMYNGGFLDGLPKGDGILYRILPKYKQFVKYQGNFYGIDSLSGTLWLPNGKIIKGRINLQNEELTESVNGKGVIFWDDYFYEGNIKKSTEHGEGKKMFDNGNYLNGTFDMGDFINGEQYNAQTQEKIIGKFKNGQPDGVVKVMVNGKTTTATFINGKKK
jgi:hypothetical protein